MINGQDLINDGLDNASCQNNGAQTWTYNQGVVLGALVELNRATGDTTLLKKQDNSPTPRPRAPRSTPNGILRRTLRRRRLRRRRAILQRDLHAKSRRIGPCALRPSIPRLSAKAGRCHGGERPNRARSIWIALAGPFDKAMAPASTVHWIHSSPRCERSYAVTLVKTARLSIEAIDGQIQYIGQRSDYWNSTRLTASRWYRVRWLELELNRIVHRRRTDARGIVVGRRYVDRHLDVDASTKSSQPWFRR